MEDIVLVGYGGHAKSMADSIERGRCFRIVGYTDMEEHQSSYPYLGTDEVLKECFKKGIRNAAICIGYLGKGNLRERLFYALKKIGFLFPVIADPSAIISESADIGAGTFVGKGAIVNAEVSIGQACIINTAAVVEHECRIEDFAHISVGTVLCGQVFVEKAAFVGANAVVIQGQTIHAGQIIPAGVTVRGRNEKIRVENCSEWGNRNK